MNEWPKDTTADKNIFYGDFHGKAWASINLVHISPPFVMRYEKKIIPSILVHAKVADSLMEIFLDVRAKCGNDQSAIDKTGISDYGGCFNIRRIAGSNNYSNHSWACAIDLSPGTNGFNMHPTLGNVVISAFKAQGWRWGGDYHGRKDPMHFEAVRS